MTEQSNTHPGDAGQPPRLLPHLGVAAGALAGWGWQMVLLQAPSATSAPGPLQPAALLAAWMLPWGTASAALWLPSDRPGIAGRGLRAACLLLLAIAWMLQAALLLLATRPLGTHGWQQGPLMAALLCMAGAATVCNLPARLPRMATARPAPALLAAAVVVAAVAGLVALGLQALRQAAPPPPAAWPAQGGLAGDAVQLLVVVAVPALLAALGVAGWMAHRHDRLLARTRDHLQQAAGIHALTGLPSRQRFEQQLQAAAMQADRRKQRIAVLCINVDGLKTINESFGPAAGDALLCAMARRLQRLVGPQDSVAHAAGDEFLMLLAGNPDRETAARAATHLIARLSDALLLDAREIATSCSVGLAMYPEDGPMRSLATRAGAAVRCAKRNGRASYCFYEPQMTEGTREQVDLLHDLRRAIERRQLELFYQPKVQAVGGLVTGAEALLRWRHPSRGLVSPVVFVPLAERSGLIGALGDWVIEEACRQIAAWQAAGQPLPVSINLSVHQLRQPDLVQRIRAAMVRHQVPPGRLRCEITESAAMDDTGTTLALVRELAAAGVPLAVDDFGTGYSSLGYLRKLPVSELKIDRSFVMDLETSADACAIVDAVIRLAHALGLTVVAEGVETEAQCRILQRLGCDELQGYLFAKPMGARMLATWAADLAPAPASRRAKVGTAVALK